MVFSRFLRKKEEPPKRYATVEEGKVARYATPLPALLPGLFAEKVEDGFAEREAICADADVLARDLCHAASLPAQSLAPLFRENLDVLLDLPIVYETLASLKRLKLMRMYENTLVVLPLAQVCAFYTRTLSGQRFHENLLVGLLGLVLRHHGAIYLKREDRDILQQDRRYNLDCPRQKDLRDQFLDQYRLIADRIAAGSVERVHARLGGGHNLAPERYKELLQILRYTTRIRGRAAAAIDEEELRSLYSSPCYLSGINAFASAWAANRKPQVQILAEEWGRLRDALAKGKTQMESPTMDALNDLFRVCRCVVITNFQNSGRDAVYCTTTKILARQEPLVAEIQESGRSSVRRFVPVQGVSQLADLAGDGRTSGRRTAAEIRERLSISSVEAVLDDETEEEDPLDEVEAARVTFRWRCYRSKEPIQVQARSLHEALESKLRNSTDPTDDELEPVS